MAHNVDKTPKLDDRAQKISDKATKIENKAARVEDKATKVEAKADKIEDKAEKIEEKAAIIKVVADDKATKEKAKYIEEKAQKIKEKADKVEDKAEKVVENADKVGNEAHKIEVKAEILEAKVEAEKKRMCPLDLTGKWKLDRSENFEEYLAATGIPYVGRKIAMTIYPMHEIIQEGDVLIVKIHQTFGNMESIMAIGKEFETVMHTSITKGKFRGKPRWEGKKEVYVVEYEPLEKDKIAFKMSREIIDGEMLVTYEANEVTGKRYFKKL